MRYTLQGEEPPDVDIRFKLVSSLINALHEMHCIGWLHRNISSKNIFSLKIKSSVDIESLGLKKPYVTDFDAARSVKACESLHTSRSELAAAINQHFGYVLLKNWCQENAAQRNTGDKLFYMPRHDYYSMGLVFLEIGMWRTLSSLALLDLPLLGPGDKLSDSKCWLEARLSTLKLDLMFTRTCIWDDSDSADEHECGRRQHIWTAYIADGPKLIKEDGLFDLILNSKDIDKSALSEVWSAWNVAYELHKLREDVLRVCREKLSFSMGGRYREVVRRCLAIDFGVSPKASENIDWLCAFSWKVVKVWNSCCAYSLWLTCDDVMWSGKEITKMPSGTKEATLG